MRKGVNKRESLEEIALGGAYTIVVDGKEKTYLRGKFRQGPFFSNRKMDREYILAGRRNMRKQANSQAARDWAARRAGLMAAEMEEFHARISSDS